MMSPVAAVVVLHCAMIPSQAPARKALGATKLNMNIVLQPDLARSISTGEDKPMPILFKGESQPGPGWIVHNNYDTSAPELMLGRVTKSEAGLNLSYGKATRQGTSFDWLETMRGTCRLAGEEVLK
jgi:hypothetical protein